MFILPNNIRVAIAGVGSCASSLIQLVAMAKREEAGQSLSGIMHEEIGGYRIKDIDFVCAFEVDQRKVGLDLADAAFTEPNIAKKHIDIPLQNVIVTAGPLLDGIDGHLSQIIRPAEQARQVETKYVTKKLRDAQADVLVCYLPTGSYEAVRAYATAALEAKVAFINATPEPVATDSYFQKKFLEGGVPLLGDDLRSHLGATTLHTALIELFQSRGIEITNTYQLNFGGNSDFFNLSSPGRSTSKQKSKRNALNAAGIDASNVSAGPNGYIQYLGDNKVCYLRLEGRSILESPISLELRLEVEDSPNSAGVVINAIRVAQTSKNFGLSGVIDEVCSLLFKSPRYGATESEALNHFSNFVRKYSGKEFFRLNSKEEKIDERD
ncbi:inositol-3-phosphate synthase [Thermoactinomyces sp. CICC 10522]|uniref:inositol-3-phosphate synthase n=1 Tax=Thermoactinomyces sp. CICC 10522 TaxID=2767427 RepID=UPI00351C1409